MTKKDAAGETPQEKCQSEQAFDERLRKPVCVVQPVFRNGRLRFDETSADLVMDTPLQTEKKEVQAILNVSGCTTPRVPSAIFDAGAPRQTTVIPTRQPATSPSHYASCWFGPCATCRHWKQGAKFWRGENSGH